MAESTNRQREILATATDHPELSHSEVAERVGCSTSDVDRVLSEYDSEEAMAARLEQLRGADVQDAGDGPPSLFGGGLAALGIKNMPPMGVAAAGVIAVAALVLADDVFADQQLFRWAIALGGVSITVLVGAVFYQKYTQAGLSEAVDWFIGRDDLG